MFWLIFFILVAIGLFIVCKFEEELDAPAEAVPALFFLVVISLIVNIALISKGVMTYPGLVSLRTEVKTLGENIEKVKSSLIKTETKIDLPNLQLATRIADYIKEYARKKAEYNSKLKYYQTIRRIRVYLWFSYAMYISKKIYELEPLK